MSDQLQMSSMSINRTAKRPAFPISKRGDWLPVAIALAFIAVAIFGFVAFENTIAIRKGEQLVAKSYAVREATRKLFAAVKDMETGERGFLITGNPIYLEPYQEGKNDVGQGFDHLRQLTDDNPVQHEHLDRLRLLIDEKQAELIETINLRRQQPGLAISDDVTAIVRSDRSKLTMDKLSQVVDEILAEEGMVLAKREATSELRASVSQTSIAAGNVIALSLIVVAGFVARIDRKKRDIAEASLQAKQSELVAVIDSARDAILVCDMNDGIISWNNGARLLYGISAADAIAKNASDLLFADHRELWDEGRKVMLATGVYSADLRLNPKAGRGHEIVVEHRRLLIRDDQQQPAAQLILNIDITERKREEAKERRSQRLESIGTLSGGIAHDLNNVLTPILMSAKLIKRSGSNHDRLADTIVASSERGSQMIKKLLAFAGGEHGTQQRMDVREILFEAEEILHHTLPKTIELTVHCAPDLAPVSGDATELSQVIMNLAINSRDAMPGGGRLEVRAENFYVDTSFAQQSDSLQSGPHVMLTVTDTGDGIPDEIIDRIFDPFFTTKEQGKGTGLGLATTLGIIRSHRGDINVASDPGSGTKFSIYLPATTAGVCSVRRVDEGEAPMGNGERILVVDDEVLIVETARATLETCGYRVTTTSNGKDALATYQRNSDSIDLVLLDMMMPGIDGFATRDGLRAINPNVRIVACSGLRRPDTESGRMDDISGFLAKPYSDEQLLRVIHEALVTNTKPEPV